MKRGAVPAALLSSFILALPTWAEGEVCGRVSPGHEGTIPEWPNEPVDFECGRGFSELSLCIINRESVEWLKNAGPQFVAINDGQSVYTLTREEHPAYPMIVRREVVTVDDGSVSVRTTACGYGDRGASDQLIEDYKKFDADMMKRAQEH